MERRRGTAHLCRRRCTCCGHDGAELQGEAGQFIFRCWACGADLYARPAMSYAEMEGLGARRSGRAVRWRLAALVRRVLAIGAGAQPTTLAIPPSRARTRSSDLTR